MLFFLLQSNWELSYKVLHAFLRSVLKNAPILAFVFLIPAVVSSLLF